MSDIDLINSLGLGDTASTPAPAENAAPVTGEDAEPATAPARAKRSEIKITGTITKKTAALLPEREAFGGGRGERGSKYPFDELAAPTVGADGVVTGYDYFEVLLADVENADADKLRAAIQAATAAANKKHKEAGEVNKYVSRTVLDDQKAYVGSAVYRVDATQDEDETAAK